MRRTARALLAASLLACALPRCRAEEPEPPPPEPPRFLVDRLAAGVEVGWFSSDELEYLTRIHFDFPFFVARHKGLYVRGNLASSISEVEQRKVFRLDVEDADYLFEAGARDYLSPAIAIAAFAGQQGSETLDGPGSARARYVGFGAQSSSFPRPGGESRFDWKLDLARVFETQETDADWMVRGDALWDAVRLQRSAIGLDLSFDALIDNGDWETDWWVGPRWSFDLANGIRTSLFARWLHSRNPLGVGATGLHVGFSYSEGAYRGPREGRFPDVHGVLAAGYGDERSPATLDVRSILPPFTIAQRPSRAVIGVEANTMVGTGPDEAWYDLSGGVETELTPVLVASAAVRHRSYHVMAADAGPARDINSLQVLVMSSGWDFSDRTPGRLIPHKLTWPGRVDWVAGPSWLISTSLESDPRWLGTAGARWSFPAGSKVQPFILAWGDFGEASRARAAAGVALPIDMTISAEYRRETLLTGRNHSASLMVSLYY